MNENDKNVLEFLDNRYKAITDMIMFADRKAAALILFNGVIITLIIKDNDNISLEDISIILPLFLSVVFSFNVLVARLSLATLICPIKFPKNLYFYGAISEMCKHEYKELLISDGIINDSDKSEPYNCDNYIEQILIISKIATKKFINFNRAVFFSLIGLIFLACLKLFVTLWR